MSKKKNQLGLRIAAVALVVIFIAGYLASAFFDEATPGFQTEQTTHIDIPFRADGTVTISNPQGEELYRGTIEIASTDQQREQGLMYRDSLGADQGMLFVFPAEAPQAFWMKNTRIPLDILYIGANGTIVSIAENAQPYDETSLPSQAPAQYVLEIPGGMCAARGIQAGDSVSWTQD